jgi:hypothetical protein
VAIIAAAIIVVVIIAEVTATATATVAAAGGVTAGASAVGDEVRTLNCVPMIFGRRSSPGWRPLTRTLEVARMVQEMRTAMRRVVLGALLCGALSGGVAALEGQVESPDTLKAFTGIWAHSEDDCKMKMSGALDRGDLDRVQTSSYELVGIYEDGLDML